MLAVTLDPPKFFTHRQQVLREKGAAVPYLRFLTSECNFKSGPWLDILLEALPRFFNDCNSLYAPHSFATVMVNGPRPVCRERLAARRPLIRVLVEAPDRPGEMRGDRTHCGELDFGALRLPGAMVYLGSRWQPEQTRFTKLSTHRIIQCEAGEPFEEVKDRKDYFFLSDPTDPEEQAKLRRCRPGVLDDYIEDGIFKAPDFCMIKPVPHLDLVQSFCWNECNCKTLILAHTVVSPGNRFYYSDHVACQELIRAGERWLRPPAEFHRSFPAVT